MTIFDVHYADGGMYRLAYTSIGVQLEGDALWTDVRRLARDRSQNRSGAVKIVRVMTGQVVWEKA